MKFDLLAAASVPLPTKNIENNPMHSREPLAKKGVKKGGRWHGCLTRKNTLTRRANQGHSLIIPQSCVRPSLRNRGRAPVAIAAQNPHAISTAGRSSPLAVQIIPWRATADEGGQ